ncbi:serine hydrolase [Prosthecochloris sp. HL-130-GSB]|jgi:serine-type D-Ala-D-Ala carboxypeptidase|uniref:serine hydrolase domain-containing protein n=1 Tax=Prosthecochloris sp. HL-130-GSB TaxID=1974213 RepID=UPI000A1C1281|nr:serine hydrolase domain-containing protein [Prosthecochloris sp. HL-130-GSB]ARM30511.1 serine hydrolase [Prosthecochloris sp. HL-130-GSB]
MRYITLVCIASLALLCHPWQRTEAAIADFTPVEQFVSQSITDGVFPSASIAVIHNGRVIFHRAFGHLTYSPETEKTTTRTIYDLASLTKPIVTTSIAMQLYERDSLHIDAPVSHYLPSFGNNGKEQITVKNLLIHNSGLKAHRFFIRTCTTPEEVYQAIDNETPVAPPGTKTIYSDLGFITLGRIIETITGRSLEENFRERYSRPLGMHNTTFNPPAKLHGRIAPTEQDTSWTLDTPRPLVHDHNAALLGGIAGHAGLFSTTEDLIIFTTMYLQQGRYGSQTCFTPETLATFTERHPGSRGLGWDLRSLQGPSSSGDHLSSSTYGHLGFTGTSIWIDPKRNLAIITLTNRVHPTSTNTKIRKFRPQLHNLIIQCIEK